MYWDHKISSHFHHQICELTCSLSLQLHPKMLVQCTLYSVQVPGTFDISDIPSCFSVSLLNSCKCSFIFFRSRNGSILILRLQPYLIVLLRDHPEQMTNLMHYAESV